MYPNLIARGLSMSRPPTSISLRKSGTFPILKILTVQYNSYTVGLRMSHRCHRLRAQNVSLQAHAIVFTVSPRGKFTPLPLFDHRRVGISSWHIRHCGNKSELKLIITLSSYHIICSHNQVVAIAVYRPYHQTASSVSTMAYHPHHLVGGLGGY